MPTKRLKISLYIFYCTKWRKLRREGQIIISNRDVDTVRIAIVMRALIIVLFVDFTRSTR